MEYGSKNLMDLLLWQKTINTLHTLHTYRILQFHTFLESRSSATKNQPDLQDLWKRALSGGKNSCREVMVAQKLFPMQAMQQIFEVSGWS